MVGKNSLHAAPRQPNELGGTGDSHIGDADSSHIHHVEVKAATKAVLRKLPTLRGTDMETYHKLFYKSKIWYVWDGITVTVKERRTNFWDDRPPTTEIILNRPLLSWVMPGGMWRPYDLDPDTFDEHEHGCLVQVLRNSYTKRPSGAMQRAGHNDRIPILTVEQIDREMDISFTALGYAAGKWPYTKGWREEGATAAMALDFCNRQSDIGQAVNCIVLHNGHKIQEFIPRNALRNSPTIVFGVFNDHAYGYKGGKQVASQKAMSGEGARDEYHAKRIREPYQHQDRPAFSEWLRWCGQKIRHGEGDESWLEVIKPGLMEEMQNGFLNLVEAAPERNAARRLYEARYVAPYTIVPIFHWMTGFTTP